MGVLRGLKPVVSGYQVGPLETYTIAPPQLSLFRTSPMGIPLSVPGISLNVPTNAPLDSLLPLRILTTYAISPAAPFRLPNIYYPPREYVALLFDRCLLLTSKSGTAPEDSDGTNAGRRRQRRDRILTCFRFLLPAMIRTTASHTASSSL